ncbi:MAG TPA: YHS domain-containing protein [Acidimicrobiales bacterium]|nr:YHS domain-containing protein [Acidimicrobiales bacterium]
MLRSSRRLKSQAGEAAGETSEEVDMAATDPVCGMSVEESDAPATAHFEGTTYYFCSTDCKEEFESDPGSYAS